MILFIKKIYSHFRLFWHFIKSFGKPKVFCLSFQRSGTKSLGKFFKDNGFVVASHSTSAKNKWSDLCMRKDYSNIINSYAFKRSQVFEDSPWWFPNFYSYLFWKFPNSKFIFLKRDSNKWFDSMMSHSNNKSLGKTHQHSINYRRLDEFYNQKEDFGFFENSNLNGLNLLESHRQHYIKVYEDYENDMLSFFEHFDRNRLFYGQLEDNSVWEKLGKFMKIKVNKGVKIYAHKPSDRL